MVSGLHQVEHKLAVSSEEIESVSEFVYFGSWLTWDNNRIEDICKKTNKVVAVAVMAKFRNIWKSKNIRIWYYA